MKTIERVDTTFQNEAEKEFSRLVKLIRENWDESKVPTEMYLDSMRLLCAELKDSVYYVQFKRFQSHYFIRIGEMQKAISLLDQILDIAVRNGYSRMIRFIYLEKASVYSFLGQYEVALQFMFRSLRLREIEGIETELVVAYHNIGLIYYKLRDNARALSYYKKALEIERTMLMPHEQVLSLSNIGLAFSDLKQFDSAKYYYERGWMSCLSECSAEAKMALYFAQGKTAIDQGNALPAELNLNESLKLAEINNDYRYQAENLVYLGRVYIAKKDEARCEDVLKRAYEIAVQNGLREILLDIYRQQIAQARIIPDRNLLTSAQEKYITLSHELYNEKLISKVSALEVDFAERENIKKISDHNELLSLQLETLKKRRVVIVLLLFSIFLFSGVVFLMVKKNNRKRKLNEMLDLAVRQRTAELEQSYSESLTQKEELDEAMKKTYEFLRSNIATLKGLCLVGANDVSDVTNVKTIKKLVMTTSEIEEASADLKFDLNVDLSKL